MKVAREVVCSHYYHFAVGYYSALAFRAYCAKGAVAGIILIVNLVGEA